MSSHAANELPFAHARSRLLDVALRAELAVTDVVSAYLGQDVLRIVYLRDEVIGPLSVNQRLKFLFDIMDREDWHDDFPCVRPVLSRVFERRNWLAHSMAWDFREPVKEDGDWVFSRSSYRRSNWKDEDFPLGRLRELVRLAQVIVRIDLDALWIRSVPESWRLDAAVADEDGQPQTV